MAMLIETTDDFIRALRENEEFLAAARREIATQDLLDLPREFKEFKEATNQKFQNIDERIAALVANTESMNRRMDAMDARMDGMDKHLGDIDERIAALVANTAAMNRRMDAMDARMDGMDKRLDGMDQHLGDMDQRLDGIDGSIKVLSESHRRQHDDLARFRGNYAADAARKNDAAIARLFARPLRLGSLRVRTLGRSRRDDLLDEGEDAVDARGIEERFKATFLGGDIIAEVRQRRRTEVSFYLAVEASFTADDYDIRRATNHAKILRCITGMNAYAVIAAVRLDPHISEPVSRDVADYLATDNEDAVLWYPLTSMEMQPPDTC